LAILVSYSLLVAFTCDGWSGRFIAPLLPLLIVLACAGTLRTLPSPRDRK
jgi:hypothetical protein